MNENLNCSLSSACAVKRDSSNEGSFMFKDHGWCRLRGYTVMPVFWFAQGRSPLTYFSEMMFHINLLNDCDVCICYIQ